LQCNVFLGVEEFNLRLTASIGVAMLLGVVPPVENLLQAVGATMYWGKTHGNYGIKFTSAVASI
jgi:hypothetical protein